MSESSPAAQLPALRLKRNEDRRLHAGHLWVFSNEVDTGQTALPKFKAGELVRVLAHNDRALGLAYVNPKSLISARMLSTWKVPDAAWFAQRIRIALVLRDVEDMPAEEVAKILNCGKATVRSHIANARVKFRKYLEGRRA